MQHLPDSLPNAKVFMVVKTYPTLSKKYGELVCTAGICEGKFVRIYPIVFRDLEEYKKFKKFQWIKVDLEKRQKDSRIESYSPDEDKSFECLEHISSEKDGWERRLDILKDIPIHEDFDELIKLTRQSPSLSLGLFKPTQVTDFIYEEVKNREWTEEEKAYYQQPDFFKSIKNLSLKKLPYKYYYEFLSKTGKLHKLSIMDWEAGAAYWNFLKQYDGDEQKANLKIKEKYMSMAKNKNLLFFVGTTMAHHNHAKNPFIIIGVVSPQRIVGIQNIQDSFSFDG